MPKKERGGDRAYGVAVQKGPISTDGQYANNFFREPDRTFLDLENNRIRRENMTITFETPKK